MNTFKTKAFFRAFEAANSNFDAETSAKNFGDVFMHADPTGFRAVPKDAFLKTLPQRKAMFDGMGITSSKLEVISEIILSPSYLLAEVKVLMSFKKTSSHNATQVEQTAWYIIKVDEPNPVIVLYLNNDTVANVMKRHGLVAG